MKPKLHIRIGQNEVSQFRQMLLRNRPWLCWEEADRRARALHAFTHGQSRRGNLEDLAVTFLDDVVNYPNITPDEALQLAEVLRRDYHRSNRAASREQEDFEEHHELVGFPEELESEWWKAD